MSTDSSWCAQEQPDRNAAALVAAFRRDVQEAVEQIKQDGDYSAADLLFEFLDQHPEPFYVNIFGPHFCAMLDLPADPWPGLTGEELDHLLGKHKTKGSWMQWACKTEGELEFIDKLRAARIRDRLEADQQKVN